MTLKFNENRNERSFTDRSKKTFHGKKHGWQNVAPWYSKITEQGQGHYYHKHVIIPGVLRLLDLNHKSQIINHKLLDLACGNGVLAQNLPKSVEYTGVDMAESLLREARFEDKNNSHKFMYGDVGKPLTIPVHFTHSTIILALQNISSPQGAISNASRHMVNGGKLVIVLNHPMFRIPRQTAWGFDSGKKLQYRRIDSYMNHLAIPINMNPSDKKSEVTMSYHDPLATYSRMLKEAGFLIESIEEWTSDKESVGRAGKMENRARAEIPLFMAISAVKK
jgi:ubiquinone/menaquinone biosynthesis C-methylase UbiE